MKVIILAGGLPSTLIEEDEKMPKPMAEIGGRPMLWHIMKQYAYYGYNDFIICTGYKGEVIKDYFMNFISTSLTSQWIYRPMKWKYIENRQKTGRFRLWIPDCSLR